MTMIIDHLYDAERGIHWYHLGAHNEPVYKKFYEWRNDKPLHYEYSDMPHDCFVFLHEAERAEMHNRFTAYIGTQEIAPIHLENFIDRLKPKQVSDDEWQMARLMAEELRAEIDRQIIAEIIRNAR